MNIISFFLNYAKDLIFPNPKFSMNINTNIFNSFNDKESLSQFTSKVNILNISYPEIHNKLMNIFRYILFSKEISLRVFDLTTEIIKLSPWTYEVWVVRRQCLSDIEEIVEILDEDNKNFHCWSHRIWMIRRFNNIEGEFEFIDKMLEIDVKNNSVWNYRFFLVEYINKNNNEISDIIKKEIKYAFDKIKYCLLNESPFSYINGLINKYKRKYKEYEEIMNELEMLYKENEKDIKNCVFVLRILLEYHEEDKNEIKFNDTIDKLINVDFIRKKYYLWRKNNFNLKKG